MTTEEKRRYDREKSRRWRAANKDKVAQINKRYHKKNGHKYSKKNVDRTREWRQNNPVLARERRRRWEENRKIANGVVTLDIQQAHPILG